MTEGLPTAEQVLASTAKYLIEGGEFDAANVLLSCAIEVALWYGTSSGGSIVVRAFGPRATYEVLSDEGNPIRRSVFHAIAATLPPEFTLDDLMVRAETITLDPEQLDELREIARGRVVHNQAVGAVRLLLWNNLRFRSRTEVKVAEALERAGVMFLPNCLARVGSPRGRVTREPDFLVCQGGRWGILEVDGADFHPPQRAAQEHERDRLFRAHGVRVVERFAADRCYSDPDGVVREFLTFLAQS
jgi:hypothetical protein